MAYITMATIQPVRSLPAVQCTSTVPLVLAAARSALAKAVRRAESVT